MGEPSKQPGRIDFEPRNGTSSCCLRIGEYSGILVAFQEHLIHRVHEPAKL